MVFAIRPAVFHVLNNMDHRSTTGSLFAAGQGHVMVKPIIIRSLPIPVKTYDLGVGTI